RSGAQLAPRVPVMPASTIASPLPPRDAPQLASVLVPSWWMAEFPPRPTGFPPPPLLRSHRRGPLGLVYGSQPVHVQVAARPPLRPRDGSQPGRHQHQGRLPVRGRPHHPRPPPHLLHDTLHRVVRPHPRPTLPPERHVRHR